MLQPGVSHHLNLVRGGAALLVLAGHVRGLLMAVFPDLPHPTAWDRGVYFLTGFGHESVIVFFVLSGYFIGSSVWRDESAWSWREYLTRRLVRLYVVLLPALLLTAVADQIAVRLPQGDAYYLQALPNFNGQPLADRMTWPALLGNAVFLQTISVPVFGSNSALWSLANEAWYYVLFPLLVLAFRSAAVSRSVFHAIAAGCLLAWLPVEILSRFPVWALGALVAIAPARRAGSRLVLAATAGGVAGALVLARLNLLSGLGLDYALGLAFAGWLYALTAPCSEAALPEWYGVFAGGLANCSYSLYAIHLPLLMLIRVALPPGVWLPGWAGYGMMLLVAVALTAAGYAFSRATEARTDAVRRWLTAVATGLTQRRWPAMPGS